MVEADGSAPRSTVTGDDPAEAGAVGPYVTIVLVALAIGVALAIYVAGYRAEIVSILTQSPT